MILIVGTVRLPPDGLAAARPAMERMITASRAEPGCLSYAYAQDVLDPGLIHVSEAWESRAALDAHAASDHIRAWRETWASLGIHDRRLALHEAGPAQAC